MAAVLAFLLGCRWGRARVELTEGIYDSGILERAPWHHVPFRPGRAMTMTEQQAFRKDDYRGVEKIYQEEFERLARLVVCLL